MAKEYIEKKTILDGTLPLIEFRKQHHINAEDYEGLVRWLSTLPAADVVEVVRCKDCIISYCNSDGDFVCGRTGVNVDDDDFCSYGERRDNNA